VVYRIFADITMLLHFGFLVFVSVGAFLLLWRRWIALIHLPAVIWGAAISFFGWICPLTPLENRLRRMGGAEGYEGGFIDYYIAGILYPQGLTRTHQIVLGLLVLLVNGAIYLWALRTRVRP
jgi:TRAP-type C4-dicarboxylate transport system permease small subunit